MRRGRERDKHTNMQTHTMKLDRKRKADKEGPVSTDSSILNPDRLACHILSLTDVVGKS